MRNKNSWGGCSENHASNVLLSFVRFQLSFWKIFSRRQGRTLRTYGGCKTQPYKSAPTIKFIIGILPLTSIGWRVLFRIIPSGRSPISSTVERKTRGKKYWSRYKKFPHEDTMPEPKKIVWLSSFLTMAYRILRKRSILIFFLPFEEQSRFHKKRAAISEKQSNKQAAWWRRLTIQR